MIKAFLFDFDGTLFDTFQANLDAYYDSLKSHGFNVDKTELAKFIKANHWSNFLPMLLKNTSDYSVFESINSYKLSIYHKYFNSIMMNKSIFKFINQLDEKVIKVIVSNASKPSIVNILNHFNCEDIFNYTFSGDTVENHKPHPDIYHNTLETLQLNANECMAFEDSEDGAKASIDAGIPTIKLNFFNDNIFK